MGRDFSPQGAFLSRPDETGCFRSHPTSSAETLQHLKNKQAIQKNMTRVLVYECLTTLVISYKYLSKTTKKKNINELISSNQLINKNSVLSLNSPGAGEASPSNP